MVHVALLSAGLLIALVGDAPDTSHDLETYQALKVKAAAARSPARFTMKVGAESRSHESSIGIDTTLIEGPHLLRASATSAGSAIIVRGSWAPMA